MRAIKITMLLLLFRTVVVGQNFSYVLKLDTVSSSGYYQIPLPMEVTGKSKLNLSDIRVFQDSLEVPYFIRDVEKVDVSTFEPMAYKIDQQEKSTVITVDNSKMEALFELYIEMNNANIYKSMVIHGSDGDTWFILNDSVRFNPSNSINREKGKVHFSFPMNDYKKIRLTISDQESAPIQVSKVYQLKYKFGDVSYQYKSPDRIENKILDNKNCLIRLKYNDTIAMERIDLSFKSEGFFRRQAMLKVRDNNVRGGFRILSRFNLDSEKEMLFDFERIKSDELYIEIVNQDNQPLALGNIQVGEVSKTLVAYLKKNAVATLKYGDQNCATARYDISQFKNELSTVSQSVGFIGKPIRLTEEVPRNQQDEDNHRIYIWIGLAVAGIGLGFFTIKSFNVKEN